MFMHKSAIFRKKLLVSARSFGYKRKVFRLQAQALSLVSKNCETASVVP